MSTARSTGDERLIPLVAAAARGPVRDGVYALWLTVRVAEGLLPPGPVSARGHRRRLQALSARLATLTVPLPLKRALLAAGQHLEAATTRSAAQVLAQLVAPAREALGNEAAEAVAVAARAATMHL